MLILTIALQLVVSIGLGILNFRRICRTAHKLIELCETDQHISP